MEMPNTDKPSRPLGEYGVRSMGLCNTKGFTKREEVAAMALSGILCNANLVSNLTVETMDWAAQRAFDLADFYFHQADLCRGEDSVNE